MKFTLIFTAALMTPVTTMAQSLSSNWPLMSPYRALPVKVHTSVTSNCASATNNAAAAWNGTNSTVILQTPSTTSTRIPALTAGASSSATEPGVINVQDESSNFGSAIMRTVVATQANGTTIVDANIYIRNDYLYYATTAGRQSTTYTIGKGYDCPSPASTLARVNHYDYQTAITHEFGHAVGFADSTSASTCPMFQTLGVGQNKRSICSSEKMAIIAIYGSK